ncbi:phosphatase 1 regulatory subunit 32-like protein [Labeo rohita]|uniref:Phosphatase 1 regulatory subunit 32-like protein n=1 Tax=Labeo rohita TaxID=84645 RepID=A0A498LQV1_LABRO|nr:phosphatase 1 regulatory subunit 32-like protein [Labeo rohita]
MESGWKGKKSKDLFRPCLGHHFGTGYSANHRPVLYYSSSLDCYDNPQFGLSLLDSFKSQTKRHYQRLVLPDGTEPLACSGSRHRESGYLQLQAQPRPRVASCQTEYKGTYIPHPLRVLVGPMEDSGYTKEASRQPNTFLPQNINMGSSGFVLNAPNITSLSHTPADPQHFFTHYQSKFGDKSSLMQQRSEWVRGGIQRHRKSGYSGRDTDRFNISGYNVLVSQ